MKPGLPHRAGKDGASGVVVVREVGVRMGHGRMGNARVVVAHGAGTMRQRHVFEFELENY